MAKKTIVQQVNSWLAIENKDRGHKRVALERASRYFDNHDAFTVNTLEAIYGQESEFGSNIKKDIKGSIGAVGHFQIEKATAEKFGKNKITKSNDYRFDVDNSSEIAAQYLVYLNKLFATNKILDKGISTIEVLDINKRKILVIAAYNAGEGRIARAQMAAEKDGKDPTRWEDIKNYLKEAGSDDDKIKEIIEYVEKVLGYELEFSKKSNANKNLKNKEPKKLSDSEYEDGHWITLDNGRHILIKDKKV